MKVMMTNKEIIEAVNRIAAMQARENESKEKLFGDRIKIIYAIKKNKDRLTRILKPYEESRDELLQECNKKEAQLNGCVDIRNDCKEKWKKGMDELLGIESEVDIHTVRFSEIEGLSLSISDLEAIDFMLEGAE